MVDYVNPGILGSVKQFKKIYEEPILRSREPDCTDDEKVCLLLIFLTMFLTFLLLVVACLSAASWQVTLSTTDTNHGRFHLETYQ